MGEADDEERLPDIGEDEDDDETDDHFLRGLYILAALWARMGKTDEAVATYREVGDPEQDGLGKAVSFDTLAVELLRL